MEINACDGPAHIGRPDKASKIAQVRRFVVVADRQADLGMEKSRDSRRMRGKLALLKLPIAVVVQRRDFQQREYVAGKPRFNLVRRNFYADVAGVGVVAEGQSSGE